MGSAGWFYWSGWGLADPSWDHLCINFLVDCWLGCLNSPPGSHLFSSRLAESWSMVAGLLRQSRQRPSMHKCFLSPCLHHACHSSIGQNKSWGHPSFRADGRLQPLIAGATKVTLQKMWIWSREEFVAVFCIYHKVEEDFAIYHKHNTPSPDMIEETLYHESV